MSRIDREWRATHLMRRASRKDVNHGEIISALRSVGAFVIDTSSLGLFVDAVCAFRGTWYLFEFKNRDTAYGRAGLNANQRKMAAAAGDAPVQLVTTSDEALRTIGAIE